MTILLVTSISFGKKVGTVKMFDDNSQNLELEELKKFGFREGIKTKQYSFKTDVATTLRKFNQWFQILIKNDDENILLLL